MISNDRNMDSLIAQLNHDENLNGICESGDFCYLDSLSNAASMRRL